MNGGNEWMEGRARGRGEESAGRAGKGEGGSEE